LRADYLLNVGQFFKSAFHTRRHRSTDNQLLLSIITLLTPIAFLIHSTTNYCSTRSTQKKIMQLAMNRPFVFSVVPVTKRIWWRNIFIRL